MDTVGFDLTLNNLKEIIIHKVFQKNIKELKIISRCITVDWNIVESKLDYVENFFSAIQKFVKNVKNNL